MGKPQVVFDVSSLSNLTPNGQPGYYIWEVNGTEADAFQEMISNLTDIASARSADIARVYLYLFTESGNYTTISVSVEYYDYEKSDVEAIDTVLGRVDKTPGIVHIDSPSQRELYAQNTSQKIIASLMAREDKGIKQEGLDRLAEVACTVANSMADSLFKVTSP